MSSKKRKQETQTQSKQSKRRKGEDGKPTPDSAVAKPKADAALPKVKIGKKKEVVINQNWSKLKVRALHSLVDLFQASLPPPNPSRVKRLERQKKEAEEKKIQEDQMLRKKEPAITPVALPISDSKELTKVHATLIPLTARL